MSGTFSGFSEEDIKNVQNGAPVNKTVDNGKTTIVSKLRSSSYIIFV